MLGSLPDNWETLVVILGNSTPQGKLTLDMRKSSLLVEEARQKEHDSSFEHKALVTETTSNRGRNNTRGEIIEKTLGGGLSLEIRQKFHACIVMVQITMKQTVERRRETKRMETPMCLTTTKYL